MKNKTLITASSIHTSIKPYPAHLILWSWFSIQLKPQKFDMARCGHLKSSSRLFEENYNFRPTKEWLDKVQKSAWSLVMAARHHYIRRRFDNDKPSLHQSLLRDLSTDELIYWNIDSMLRLRKMIENTAIFVSQLMMVQILLKKYKQLWIQQKRDSEKVVRKNEKIMRSKQNIGEELRINYESSPCTMVGNILVWI